MWHIYTMEYYSAIKTNEVIPFAATWMNIEIIILSEVNQRGRQMLMPWGWFQIFFIQRSVRCMGGWGTLLVTTLQSELSTQAHTLKNRLLFSPILLCSERPSSGWSQETPPLPLFLENRVRHRFPDSAERGGRAGGEKENAVQASEEPRITGTFTE